jgi:hypothetical protein
LLLSHDTVASSIIRQTVTFWYVIYGLIGITNIPILHEIK